MRKLSIAAVVMMIVLLNGSCLRTYVCACETVRTDTVADTVIVSFLHSLNYESENRDEAQRICKFVNNTVITDTETSVTTCSLK